jgi:hypothetical protein
MVSPKRLTDEEWRTRIGTTQMPPRPEWVRTFQAKTAHRELTPPKL